MKSIQSRIIAVMAFLNLMLAFTAQSYPITPRPLRKLIAESEFIVVVHIRELKELGTELGDSEAVLDIKDVLQGIINESTIQVRYNPHMVCPAPPRFQNDADAIVFLDRNDRGFSVHALSYGVKVLSPDVIEVYTQRIQEMQMIMKLQDNDQKFVETTEWLVKCAEYRDTRYEGSYELSQESNFMSYYDRDEKQPFAFSLTDDQKLRLKDALLNTASSSYTDFGLVDLVYARYTSDVFPYLVKQIRQLNEDDLWYAEEYMSRINLYKSNRRTKELVKRFNDIQYEDKKMNKMRGIVSDFVKEIDRL